MWKLNESVQEIVLVSMNGPDKAMNLVVFNPE
jgi:hypothetical protein